MNAVKTKVEGAIILEPDVFGDNRGWFMESYSKKKLSEVGIDVEFVQDNRSFSAEKGTLRGLHCQLNPTAQSKLLTCIRGKILDVAVDIRKGSPTYMQWEAVELSGENKKSFFIPKGCLHGFLTLTDDVEVMYKVDEFYSPADDRSIRYDDPELGVDWGDITPILSQKDMNAPLLKDSDVEFTY
jgi:dTDP-4-dehydrorhamnose reductase/dTDP-4-dehydrorhamnose 3,5-epimerase